MTNAGRAAAGHLALRLLYKYSGFNGCLIGSAIMVLTSAIASLKLPNGKPVSLDLEIATTD